VHDYLHMPRIMVQLSLVQFFTWFTWFSMWTYGTATVTQHIYHATDTHSALYNDGASRRVRRSTTPPRSRLLSCRR
jgi:maltose/moltooligosaccharide transporter